MIRKAQRKKSGTMPILSLAVGLLLACLTGPSHAVEVCWDYPVWRVSVYENRPAYAVPDVNNMTSLPVSRAWLASNSAKYELVQQPWQVNDDSAPPIALKHGDVILLKAPGAIGGTEGHAGFVNAQGTIDHYLQLYDLNNRQRRERYDPRGFIPQRCPDQSTPLSQVNTCPGWRIDRITGQAKPICCGLFQGDSWEKWLDRQSAWKGGYLEIWREKDTDKDGVPDWKDKCANTPANERLLVDADGCAFSQRDDDGDGVKNDKDLCPDTPRGEKVDVNGCSFNQRDDDGDGVKNDKDLCANTPQGEPVDGNGCSVRQLIKLTIDANDPIEAGAEARFTAKIDPSSEVALQGMADALTYEWLVDNQPSGSTSATLTKSVPANYGKDTMTVTVHLIAIKQGQRIPVVQASKTVRIKKPSGRVLMYRSGGSTREAGKQSTYQPGGSTQEVGKQATYQARVEDPGAANQTLYAYYWSLNGQDKTRGYNQTTFSFAIPQKGTNTIMVQVMKTGDRGKTWQKVGEATDSFVAQGQPVGPGIRPFVGSWKQPYHGGVATLTFNADGSGTGRALGTELTNGQPNKEVGTISRCVAEGQTLKCYWESTYSDGDKTISRGGTLTCAVNGDTLTATSTVDRATLKEKWNIPPNSYTPGARSGGTSTYTRVK